MERTSLLTDIEAFCTQHGMAESTFGREAVNDWKFIRDLRGAPGKRPRRFWPETEERVRQFMRDYQPEAASTDTQTHHQSSPIDRRDGSADIVDVRGLSFGKGAANSDRITGAAA